jgi:hypothetical protein
MLDLAHELFITTKNTLLVWVINNYSWAKNLGLFNSPTFFFPPFSILFDSWSIRPPSIYAFIILFEGMLKFSKKLNKIKFKGEKNKIVKENWESFEKYFYFQHEIFKIN